MHEMLMMTPAKFKAHCIMLTNNKQDEINKKNQIRDNYIRDISSKRDEYNRLVDEYSEAYASPDMTVVHKVEMFKNNMPEKPNHMNIYTYYQPTIFLKDV